MFDVKERDWKIFRKKIIIWQENYMQKLNNEYIEILKRDNDASKNFWDLERRNYKNKTSIWVAIDMRRSKMHENIWALLKDVIITFDDLNDFSDDFKSEIKYMIDRW